MSKGEYVKGCSENLIVNLVGKEKRSYYITNEFIENINTGIIFSRHYVAYYIGVNSLQIIFTGKYSECLAYINIIVKRDGRWITNPNNPFEKIFTKDIDIIQ